jgi:CheY-like chemotaxis protein
VIVAEALLEAESMIRRVLPENISVSIDSRATIEDLVVDPDQLQSSILNIAINARDAMPDGGRLKIDTYDQDVGEHIVQSDSGDLEPGRYLAISVSDTGIGMEASTRDKSIEPFFTTKSVGEGSGLGLSMVHGFTRQSEGALEISSELGSGTSGIMLFPVVLGDTFECEKMDALPSESHGGRILVAEDEVAVGAVLEGILKAAGYDVVSATSGDAAKALFEANPTFDLLVTDIVMPGSLQGTELSKELRAIKDELPVVFMSGYAAEATVHGNGLRPEDTRLMKPVKRRDLLEAISRALRN